MPVYEYLCGRCDRKFELRVTGTASTVECPGCRSREVRKLFSVFGLNLGAAPDAPQFAGCSCGRGG